MMFVREPGRSYLRLIVPPYTSEAFRQRAEECPEVEKPAQDPSWSPHGAFYLQGPSPKSCPPSRHWAGMGEDVAVRSVCSERACAKCNQIAEPLRHNHLVGRGVAVTIRVPKSALRPQAGNVSTCATLNGPWQALLTCSDRAECRLPALKLRTAHDPSQRSKSPL
jgi:hypothetical protein